MVVVAVELTEALGSWTRERRRPRIRKFVHITLSAGHGRFNN